MKNFIGRNLKVNYKNKSNVSLASFLIKRYQAVYSSNDKMEVNRLLQNCVNTLVVLRELEYNFNEPFDEKRNTPLMFFMRVE